MTFTPHGWKNLPSRETPLDTLELNTAEEALYKAAAAGAETVIANGKDQTSELETAIATTPKGGTIWLAPSSAGEPIKVKETITIEKSLTLRGTGMNVEYGTLIEGTFNQQVMPSTAPYMRGSVIEMTEKNKDVIHITGDGICVNIYDLGIIFKTLFKETGHGIVGKYKTASGVWGAVPNNGPMGMVWSNLCVFGHDGNHYAYELINSQLNSFNQLQWFGGGALKWDASEYEGKFGSPTNSTITELYGVLCARGTAHGVSLIETNTVGTTSLTFLRPQIMALKMNQFAALAEEPDFTKQFAYRDHGKGTSKNTLMISPDIEGGAEPPGNPKALKIEGTKTSWLGGFFGGFVETGTLGVLEVPGTLESGAFKAKTIEPTTSLSVPETGLLAILGNLKLNHELVEITANPTLKATLSSTPIGRLSPTLTATVRSLEDVSTSVSPGTTFIFLKNVGNFTVTLAHENAGGTNANQRFNFSAGVDLKLAPGQAVALWHNGERWVDFASTVKRPAQLPKITKVENKFVQGIPGLMRTQIIAWDAKKEAETKVKHELQTTQILSVKAYKWTEAANTDLTLQAEVKITSFSIVSSEELTIKWEAEPAKEEEIGIVLQGL